MENKLQSKADTKLVLSLAANAAIVIMELVSLPESFANNGWGLFRYYTEDSNIFALGASFMYVIYAILRMRKNTEIPKAVRILKYASSCTLTVTFLVVVFVLLPMYGWDSYGMMLFGGSMLYHHTLCPILSLLSLLFLENGTKLLKNAELSAVVPTLAYAAVTVVLNIMKVMKGPYPFLYVYEQPIWLSCVWFTVIIGMAFLISLGIKKIFNHISEKME